MSEVTEEETDSDMEEGTAEQREREMEEARKDPLVRTMMHNLLLPWDSVTGNIYEPCSIHIVPKNIRDGDPGSYEPQILSIGPYHHGNPKLQDMEKHKWRYLYNLLRRKHPDPSARAPKILLRWIEVVRGSERQARSYYSEPIRQGTNDFVKMMVLDGCFIIELLLRFPEQEDDSILRFHSESEEDPILNVGWMCNAVRRDILKLENQIPFFILQKLFDLTVGRGATDGSLRQHAFYYLMLRRADEKRLTEHKIYHLLHFYDVILLPNKSPKSPNTRSVLRMRLPTWRKPKPTSKLPPGTIPCVVKLEEVGIKLRMKPAETFLDVTFQDGTLYIPFLSIHDETNSVFRNLVALEQCRPDLGSHFTWYVTFLDCIVNTPMDVSILQKRGILDNTLGSEKEVAQLINLLGKGMTINGKNPNFAKLFREVNKHCQSRWHEHRARLMRDYFSNPWTIISLVAAVCLLLMTAAQVVLAVLSYNKQ